MRSHRSEIPENANSSAGTDRRATWAAGRGERRLRRQMCYDRDRADGYLTARLSHAALFARQPHLRKAVQKKRESGGNEVFHQEVGKEEGRGKGLARVCLGDFSSLIIRREGVGSQRGPARAHGERGASTGPLTGGQAGGVERKDSLVG